ncbi:site-specific integrase [Geomonas sp. Red69]|uniref:site-specific integrase n=1 Tax=Geomonas diazotrophica TaxID=2843197 RepID=UPI001C10DD01|nr:site-specific integrase [Geomonas diazotrophica]MBU5636554.1 site-specific integrase [Geomonas diazotrophica]
MRFRSVKSQAEHAVSNKVALGTGRHDHRDDGKIHSVGTARGYQQALKGFANYIQKNRFGSLGDATRETAIRYLAERAEAVSQKTLDLDRQAIQMHLGERLDVVKSARVTILSTRSYTPAQVQRIAASQSERNSLATKIAYSAGLRAHELLTIRREEERAPSSHREWSTRRFLGRDGVRYTVEGKGGLIREVLLDKALAVELESKRLAVPNQIVDRVVRYSQFYNIGGGRTWSQSFSAASTRALGFSNGAHGLRHSYAQERMDELQRGGMPYDKAKAITAQEVGHFEKKTTEAYLR